MAQIIVDMHKAKQRLLNQRNQASDDQDSDFDPTDVAMNDYSTTTSVHPPSTKETTNSVDPPLTEEGNSNTEITDPIPTVVQRRHRYQTRSTSVVTQENTTVLEMKEEEIDQDASSSQTKEKRRRKRKRPQFRRGKRAGRPPKKKSNLMDISTKGMSKEEEKKLRARLAKMDEYDTQQYIESVVEQIKKGEYVHPFQSKETAIPRRRINKIIRADPNFFKVASVTTEMMAILIEIFVRDLVSRSYKYTLEDNRKSLKMQDLCRAVQADHMYDFLIDVVPRIHSYDEQTNLYSFIYAQQIQNCVLAQIMDKRNGKQGDDGQNGQDQIGNEEEKDQENKDRSGDVTLSEVVQDDRGKELGEESSNMHQDSRSNVRRSKRLKSQSKRSDKMEAD